MTTLSRRKNLNVQFDSSFHAGLWMDRYIEQLHGKNDKENFYTEHFQQVTQSKEPSFYARFYEEWQRALQASGAVCHEATVQGRMAVGLGDESVLETSVALHHTYGVPYIPGSALKGLAASFVRQWLEGDKAWGTWERDENGKKQAWKPGPAYEIVFGNTDTAGYITFFDALYIPGTGYKEQALYPDIITVHHKEYYGSGNTPPADWDSPTPVPFLSATGTYLIALAGPDDWVGVVFKLLARALAEMGIGAKTSSGYGRMKLGIAEKKQPQVQADPDQATVDDLIQRITELPINRVANELNRFVQEWKELSVNESLKQQVAQAIVDKVREAKREKKSSEKAWYKELQACLQNSEKGAE